MPKRKTHTCPVHGDATHGGEAEQLRAGIEKILERSYDAKRELDGDDICVALQKLLDETNACDALAWIERHDEKRDAEVDALHARIARMQAELAYREDAFALVEAELLATGADHITLSHIFPSPSALGSWQNSGPLKPGKLLAMADMLKERGHG